MKSKSLIRDNHIYKSLLIVPVTLIAFSACSNVPGTTQDRPTTGYGAYVEQPQQTLSDQREELDPDPSYEWFY
jgi:hypothetical protein